MKWTVFAIFPDKTEATAAVGRSQTADGVVFLGGLRVGYSYQEFYVAAESIHQNVNFSGYPIGGITMETALFGSIEDLCKAQDPFGPTAQ
jgi:hypothetical protein